jgi:hypothetical protein
MSHDLITPHARQVIDNVAVSPSRFNRLVRLTGDDGSSLTMTQHDEFVVNDTFHINGFETLADLKEIHAYIVAKVIIPTANA